MAAASLRLDIYLCEQGLCASRSDAQRRILAGQVLVNNRVVDKCGATVQPETDQVRLKQEGGLRYVSRGGLKLEAALETFRPTTEGIVALDVGASTGGFTDCLLQAGAKRVYAVDVGYNQLAWSLRNDPRVVVMERTNARHLLPDTWPGEHVDAIVCDASFISLCKLLPVVVHLAQPAAWMVALLKPQFEARDCLTPQQLRGFDGVVRKPALRQAIVDTTLARLQSELGAWQLVATAPCPVLGPKGNEEWLTYWESCSHAVG